MGDVARSLQVLDTHLQFYLFTPRDKFVPTTGTPLTTCWGSPKTNKMPHSFHFYSSQITRSLESPVLSFDLFKEQIVLNNVKKIPLPLKKIPFCRIRFSDLKKKMGPLDHLLDGDSIVRFKTNFLVH